MKSKAFIAVVLAFTPQILSGCSSQSGAALPVGVLAVPDAPLQLAREKLTIAPLDILEIKVFGVPDLEGEYQVDPEGRIKFPLVGIVDAKDSSAFDLAGLLERRLGEGFLQNPQVTVRISEASGEQVTVEGAVAKPGMYPVRGKVSLIQAIALSGGPTRAADPNRVVIFRTIEGKRMAAAFDLQKIRAGEAEDPRVYGNDVIVIDGSELREGFDEFLRTIPLLGLFVYQR